MSINAITSDARNALGDYVTRIESLIEEKTEAAERIKAEYAEAAGAGFDKLAIQQIIKERAADAEKSIRQREIVETYRTALAGLVGTPLGDWARQWVANDTRVRQRSKNASDSAMDDFMKKRSKSAPNDDAAPPAS
jgi:uncharacterized protein (UPF0335 family)